MGPGGGILNTVVLFACIYFVGKIDFVDADNLLRLRVTYGIVQALVLAAFAYIYVRITSVADRTPVTLADGTRTTVEQYDLSKLKEFVRGSLMGTGISLFIHLKMGVVPPLFIQCTPDFVRCASSSTAVMGPIQTGQNPLVRIYLLGDRSAELTTRPWKEAPSPFAALLGQTSAADANAPVDGPAPAAIEAEAEAENTTAAEVKTTETTEAAETIEAAAEEVAEPEEIKPKAKPASPAEDKKPASGKKGKSKNKPATAAPAAAVVVEEKSAAEELPAAAVPTTTKKEKKAEPEATPAPAAAAVSALSESQEEPASPSAEGVKPAAARRRKPKAEQ